MSSTLAAAPDPLPVLLALLLATTTLNGLVSGGDVDAAYASIRRVYTTGLPSPPITSTDYEDVLPATLVVSGLGFVGRGPGFQAGNVELRAYHHTHASARALWYVALNVLRRETPYRSGGVTVLAQESFSGPFAGVEPGGGFLMQTGTIPITVLGTGT